MSFVRAFVVLGALAGGDDCPAHPYGPDCGPLTCIRAEQLVAIYLGVRTFLNGSSILLTLVVFY
jgi:hypothetical protein